MSSYAISLAPSARRARRWLPGTGDLSVDFLWLLLALTLLRGVIYALLNPPFASPDEKPHLQYVANLATAGASGPRGTEGGQPVPYYALMVPAYWLTAGQAKEVQDLAIRLASLAFLLGIVLFAWLAGRRLAPTEPIVPAIAAAFVALHPQLAYIGASANNDNAANLMAAVLTYLGISLLSSPMSRWTIPTTALAIGAGIMTKGAIVPVLALVCLVLLARIVQKIVKAGPRRAAIYSAAAVLVALLALKTAAGAATVGKAWWFISSHDWSRLAEPFQAGAAAALSYEFSSFWAAFIAESVRPSPIWYAVPTTVATVGLATTVFRVLLSWIQRRGQSTRQTVVLGFLAAMLVAQWVTIYLVYAWSSDDQWRIFSLQGRYLFPALGPLALLTAYGVGSLPEGPFRPWAYPTLVGLLLVFDAASMIALLAYRSWSFSSTW